MMGSDRMSAQIDQMKLVGHGLSMAMEGYMLRCAAKEAGSSDSKDRQGDPVSVLRQHARSAFEGSDRLLRQAGQGIGAGGAQGGAGGHGGAGGEGAAGLTRTLGRSRARATASVGGQGTTASGAGGTSGVAAGAGGAGGTSGGQGSGGGAGSTTAGRGATWAARRAATP